MKLKNLIIILLSSIIIFSCRNKVKVVETEKVKTHEQIKTDSVIEKTSKLSSDTIIKNVIKDNTKVNSLTGDIEIKGKSDTIKPFIYHNVQNGDTIQSISIIGNADFVIKSKFEKTESSKNIDEKSEKLNLVAEFSRKAVSQETIKNAVSDFKKVENKVSVHSSPFGMIVFYTIICISVIAAIWLFYYLGGKIEWKQLFSKFVKNK